MKNCYMIAMLCLCALAGCTKPRVSVVLIPNDRFLEPVYAADGTLVHGRSSIADGYLREIMQDLTYCRKEANP